MKDIKIKQRISQKSIILSKSLRDAQTYINWFVFFMAFPVILILGQNVSIIIFLFIVIYAFRKINIFKISNSILILPLLFALGAIISVIDINVVNSESISNSFSVLPNYLYWSLLVIVVVNLKKIIQVEKVVYYTMLGVLFTVIYYVFQFLFFNIGFIFNKMTPNSFSFILICFFTPSFIYLFTIKKRKFIAIVFLLLTLTILISEGRRAGTMLVLLPSIFALIFTKIEIRKLAFGFIVFFVIFSILQTQFAEKIVESMNPRIYSLLYKGENITTEDRSYLIRRLQVEKALLMFVENPFTGIGLNNFSNYNVDFVGDFVGSEFVINKENMNNKSAHNSYVNLLAEGGLLLLMPLLILFSYNFIQFIKKYNYRSQIENSYYWSFLAMCIHLYFITGIVNVYVWFLISLVTMISVKYASYNINVIRKIPL